MQFKTVIKDARKKKKFTQSHVADHFGYTTMFISNWERGLSTPPPKAITPLSKLLGLKRDELLDLVVKDTCRRNSELIRARYGVD